MASHKWDQKNITKNPFALLLVLAVLAFGAYSLSAQPSETVSAVTTPTAVAK